MALADRKRADADRITDLNNRLDELERELTKLSLVTPPGDTPGGGVAQPAGGDAGGGGDEGGGGGRVAVLWAAVEELEESLFTIKPEEIKVSDP